MGSNMKLTYNVDIVMCVDATYSMDGLIDKVKDNALNFHSDVIGAMAQKGKTIDKLRVRIVAFRDYYADGVENAILCTDFYELPRQAADFRDALSMIRADGGGDDPEDGLEALAYAMKSDWCRDGQKRRQLIVVWSDEGTHALGQGPKMNMPGYPARLPRSFDELTEMWEDDSIMNFNAKRLILFTPGKEYWGDISDSWNNVVHFPSEAGNGLGDVDYSAILQVISNTL